MRYKILFSVLIIFVLMPLSAFSAEKPKIDGDYTTVATKDFNFDGTKVEVIEFMSFYCNHCYKFEKQVAIIKGNFPKKIDWQILPVYWGDASPKPGVAYFIAKEAGKGEEMKKAIFNANFVDRQDIGKLEVLEKLAKDIGLGNDFSKKLRGGAMAHRADYAQRMAGIYQLDETPTVIIAGNISTNPHASNHDLVDFRKNIITIIKSIVK